MSPEDTRIDDEPCCDTAPEAVPAAADADLAALARALGHPIRVAILRRLLRYGDCVCNQLVDVVPRAQSTVSQHLKILKQAGLVRGEIDGARVCYCADVEAVRRLQRLVGDLAPGAP